MEIKGILFDKDGTLIDFFKVWEPAIKPVLERLLAQLGLEFDREEKECLLKRLGYRNGKIDPEGAIAWKSYRRIARDLGEACPVLKQRVSTEKLADILRAEFYTEVAKKRQEYPTFTDLPALCRMLTGQGIQLGVATTDDAASTRHCLDCLKITPYISFWGTADGQLPEKPDPKLLYMAAAQWKVLPEEIAVVGDTPNDMRFAENAHATGIAVLSGTGSRLALEPLADVVIGSVDDLWKSICDLKNV